MNRGELLHKDALDFLINHLDRVGEGRPRFIIREGIYQPNGEMVKFPDLILLYDNFGVPLELKHSMSRRHNACIQLANGRDFIRDELNRECTYGKLIIYNEHMYNSHRIEYGSRRS